MIVFKVIILGDAGSGKSCLMSNYLGQPFCDNDPPTIGVEFGSKVLKISNVIDHHLIDRYREHAEGRYQLMINDLSAKMQLWGTSGQERFHSIVKSYYRNVNGCLFVCDLSQKRSYNHLRYWLDDFQKNSNFSLKEIGAAIIGNKTDLEDLQEVYEEDLQKIANEYHLPYYMVSSKNDKEKIKDLFNELANSMFEKFLENPDEHFKELQTLQLEKDGKSSYYKDCCIIA